MTRMMDVQNRALVREKDNPKDESVSFSASDQQSFPDSNPAKDLK